VIFEVSGIGNHPGAYGHQEIRNCATLKPYLIAGLMSRFVVNDLVQQASDVNEV